MSHPPIYDDRDRTDLTPQRNSESSFAFFSRAGGSLWKHSRALHQEWADHLGHREYIEAIAPGTSLAERSKANRMNDLLAALDQVGDDNFFLMTTSIVQADNSAPAASFRQDIQKWLATLDPDAVDTDDLPTRTFARDGWSITVEAIPIRADSRGNVRRSIGVYAHNEAHFINDGEKGSAVGLVDSGDLPSSSVTR